jgi:hypothetical protein
MVFFEIIGQPLDGGSASISGERKQAVGTGKNYFAECKI